MSRKSPLASIEWIGMELGERLYSVFSAMDLLRWIYKATTQEIRTIFCPKLVIPYSCCSRSNKLTKKIGSSTPPSLIT